VQRLEKNANQYPILLYFVGDNNIEEAAAFEKSSQNKKPWKVKHPYYDEITVQPIALKFDNRQHNLTIITGTVIETIQLKAPISAPELVKTIESLNLLLNESITSVFINTPVFSGITTVSGDTISKLDLAFKNLAVLLEQIETYLDYARQAKGAAENVISGATRYINRAIQLINYPYIIEQNIRAKINAMLEAFDNLLSVLGINNDFIETHGAAILSNVCLISLSAPTEYKNRAEVISVINAIQTKYTANIDKFTNPDIALQLDKIINFTLGGLLNTAQNSKQVRTIYLTYPDNIVNLAVKYFGQGDDNLNLFIETNGININEFLTMPAGRQITYFV
jgi:hypothetical protein